MLSKRRQEIILNDGIKVGTGSLLLTGTLKKDSHYWKQWSQMEKQLEYIRHYKPVTLKSKTNCKMSISNNSKMKKLIIFNVSLTTSTWSVRYTFLLWRIAFHLSFTIILCTSSADKLKSGILRPFSLWPCNSEPVLSLSHEVTAMLSQFTKHSDS